MRDDHREPNPSVEVSPGRPNTRIARRNELTGARRIVIFVLPGAFSLDVLGCFEIFKSAARVLALRACAPPPLDPMDEKLYADCELAYEVELVSVRAGAVETSSGTSLYATRALSDVQGTLDTFIVAGGDVRRMMGTVYSEPELLSEFVRVTKLARRLASVCTGAFLLAAAGLLDGKRATTHWAACVFLEKLFPRVKVERDPIYTQEGHVYTSAGASTGMDLSLALVRDDHGSEIASTVARWLVLYVERPSGQAQISAPLRTRETDRAHLRDLKTWIVEHPEADLSIPVLAKRVGMSVRNFGRAFRRGLSISPGAYVEAIRVEAARRKLELTNASLDEIAAQIGFHSAGILRRAFIRQTGAAPSACRTRLARTPRR